MNEADTYQETRRPDEIFRDKLWDDWRKRRQERTCNRCGEYLRYWIEETKQVVTTIIIPGDKTETFYKNLYKKVPEPVENKGNLIGEPWYDICKRCQDHVRGIKTFYLHSSLDQINKELAVKREIEQRRLMVQSDQIQRLKNRINRMKKGQSDYETAEEFEESI